MQAFLTLENVYVGMPKSVLQECFDCSAGIPTPAFACPVVLGTRAACLNIGYFMCLSLYIGAEPLCLKPNKRGNDRMRNRLLFLGDSDLPSGSVCAAQRLYVARRRAWIARAASERQRS